MILWFAAENNNCLFITVRVKLKSYLVQVD